MQIISVIAKNVIPITNFQVQDLSDIVVLAGPNGVGKTRLFLKVLEIVRSPNPQSPVTVRIRATCQEEREAWGKECLDTQNADDCRLLTVTLQKNRMKRKWRSSLVNFESNRSVTRLEPLKFSWDLSDPDEETENWEVPFNFLRDRFSTTVQDIFKLLYAQRNSIATRAVQLRQDGKESMNLEFEDPLQPFKDAFSQLLAPKELLNADLKRQKLRFRDEHGEFDIDQLSSGEREVVNIVFDFILHGPSDCIVLFDEPELHLHPELSYRLIQTLRNVGQNNQFIFCTHSADIITSSLDNTVVFIRPADEDNNNQAVIVSDHDDTHEALRLIGQSIGIVSLGKKIVLIEGDQSALDKQTYGAIIRSQFPNLVLVPSEGRETLESFSRVQEKVLNRSIWGIDFYMLADGDVDVLMSDGTVDDTKSRLKFLPRYHLENYFLDAKTISNALASIMSESPYLNEKNVTDALRHIAEEQLSYATMLVVTRHFRLQVGNFDLTPKKVGGLSLDELLIKLKAKSEAESARIASSISDEKIEDYCQRSYEKLRHALDNDEWRTYFPGRPIFGKLCGTMGVKTGHMKKLYIDAARAQEQSPFEEIIAILEGFSIGVE